jgi:cation diffusion facilitator CzcD-associated flavoprotein CzcO
MTTALHAPAGTVPIAIIGTGFAGLGMAIRLRQEGREDFVLLEKNTDVGGTWWENHYPGCACDIESHLYSFSFAPNPGWSRMFSPQPEIQRYLRGCAERHDLLPRIRFNTMVVGARYDEAAGLWLLRTADATAMRAYLEQHGLHPGDAIDWNDPALPPVGSLKAQVVISGMGGLSTPAYPQLPGLETFRGKAFHSQNWDHDYDLAGKRVAVIGTGASSIQFVPQIAPKVARLDLYQRTPPWIVPKPDRPVTRFERWLFRALPFTQRFYRGGIYAFHELLGTAFVVNPRLMKLIQGLALRHIRRQIADPELRRKVTPDYTIGCKRILISDDYYPALTRANVDVVTAGIRELRAHSIVTADGVEHEVDCIIFGTGFRATDPLPRGVIFGRHGQDLLDAWQDGPEAYKGTAVAGFPNLFFIVGPNTGLGHNSMVYMIESQIAYILDALKLMRDQQLQALEVRAEVQAAYNAKLQRGLKNAIWSVGGCRSWYLLPNGKNVTLWPGYTWQFRRQTRRFDAAAYALQPLPATESTSGSAGKARKAA